MTTNAFWQQGEVQAGRSLARPHDDLTSWAQTLLLPPDVLEIRLRLGFILPDHHGRWLLEALDPTRSELLAMASQPHFAVHDLADVMQDVGVRLHDMLGPLIDPDPFP